MINKRENIKSIDVMEICFSTVAILRLTIKEPRIILKLQGIALSMYDSPEGLILCISHYLLG